MASDAPKADRLAILAVDEQYIKAFNSKDIATVIQSFAEDAVYVTDYGKTLNGRAEIERELKSQFDETGDSTLKLNVYSVVFSADRQKATERGVSIVTEDGVDEPSSYVAEFTKQQDGAWRVSRVVETAQAASATHLRRLEWMIGEWDDQSEDSDVRTNTEWALDRAFLTRRFAVSIPGQRELKGIEYIGWDPIKGEIHSWYFDSDGGYGGGRWKQEGKSWVEEVVGITPKGEATGATHVFTPKDADTFTWRSINRSVGGEKVDDIPEVTIKKMKSEQAESEMKAQPAAAPKAMSEQESKAIEQEVKAIEQVSKTSEPAASPKATGEEGSKEKSNQEGINVKSEPAEGSKGQL